MYVTMIKRLKMNPELLHQIDIIFFIIIFICFLIAGIIGQINAKRQNSGKPLIRREIFIIPVGILVIIVLLILLFNSVLAR